MPRRRTVSEAGVSLDSLMDAMTNVVAVLILVLLLVQVDVKQTVQRFIDELQPATPEELAEAQEQHDLLIKKRDSRLSLIKSETKPDPSILEKEKQAIAQLKQSIAKQEASLKDQREAGIRQERLRQERDTLKARTVSLGTDIEKLGVELGRTPIKKARPDIVSIPVSRDIPKGANLFYCYIFEGRIHLIDPVTPKALFENELKRNENKFKIERIKKGNGERLRFNAGQLHNHFKNFDWRNNQAGQTVQLISAPHWNRIRIRITPDRKKGGISAEELRQPDSLFHQMLRGLSRNPNNCLMFRVHTSDFDTYLDARKVADAMRVPSGWEVHWARHHEFQIYSMELKPTENPPPPTPTGPGDKPKPPSPPNIKPTLD